MILGSTKSELPRFFALASYEFEGLCRDLFDHESEISTCEIFGQPGQSQYGIDLLAYRKHDTGIEVGQSKCYESFPPKKIEEASDAFFRFWDSYWKDRDVRRFILFVACDLSNRQRQEEIERQKQRFAQYGIKYEAWSAAIIQNRLRPHPGIVATYLHPPEHWIKQICGEVSSFPETQQTSSISLQTLDFQIRQQSEIISDDTEKQLNETRQALRKGDKKQVLEWLSAVQNEKRFSSLQSEIKARILRFEAIVELNFYQNLDRAKALRDSAKLLGVDEDTFGLDAIIVYFESGPEKALHMLEEAAYSDGVLKVKLLLELGRINDAEIALETIKEKDDPDHYFVQSLIGLARKDLPYAKLAILKAMELQPDWLDIKITNGKIYYFSAIASAAVSSFLVSFPEPVDWLYLKRDNDSTANLQRSQEIFESLVKSDIVPATHNIEIWYLASLANDVNHQSAAANYSKQLLAKNPQNYPVILWNIARRLGVDLQPSKDVLERVVETSNASVSDILALVHCYFEEDQFTDALNLIQITRPIFESDKSLDIWDYWYITALLTLDELEQSLDEIENFDPTPPLLYVKIQVLKRLAAKTKEWYSVQEYIEYAYSMTKDSRFLWEVCELSAFLGNWQYIIDRKDELLHTFDTEATLRLIVNAAYAAKQFELCLELLDNNNQKFEYDKLPVDLRQLRVACQRGLGILSEAIQEAAILFLEDPAIDNLLNLAQLYYDKGDIERLLPLARRLMNYPEAPPELLFIMSQHVQIQDKNLARDLWRKAVDIGLSDDFVGPAWIQGINLALGGDERLRKIRARAQALGHEGKGGIFALSTQEVIEFSKNRSEDNIDLDKLYKDGKVSIHLAAHELNVPIVELYHSRLTNIEKSYEPLRQFSLYVRHGGLGTSETTLSENYAFRLNVDVISLILAQHVEILDEVESIFRPIRIPYMTLQCLQEQQQRLFDRGGLHEKEALQSISNLIAQRKIHVIDTARSKDSDVLQFADEFGSEWANLFELAKANNGFLVCYLPIPSLKTPSESILEDRDYKDLTNCRGVLESLKTQGKLTNALYFQSINILGAQGELYENSATPLINSKLYFFHSTVKILAGAGLLEIVCDNFAVNISQDTSHEISAKLQNIQSTEASIEWLGLLIRRLTDGIDSGNYELIPNWDIGEDSHEEDIGSFFKTTIGQCLRTLLKLKGENSDVIWTDDRFLNGHSNQEYGVPFISIYEVLNWIYAVQGLAKKNWLYLKIHQLRASNIKFMPLHYDELLSFLFDAQIIENHIVETYELSVLRKYIAASLIQVNHLQLVPHSADNLPTKNELSYLMSMNTAWIHAIGDIWLKNDIPDERRPIYSEWIIENLYVPHSQLANDLKVSQLGDDEQRLLSITFAGLLSQALFFNAESFAQLRLKRKRYFEWLANRLINRQIESSPPLLRFLAESLKGMLQNAKDSLLQFHELSNVIPLLVLYFEDLPESIQAELENDFEFMVSIGFSGNPVINFDGLSFSADEFWSTVVLVVNGQQQTIYTFNTEEEITFFPKDNDTDDALFNFLDPRDKKRKPVTDSIFTLLNDSPRVRENWLRSNRFWFDIPVAQFDEIVMRIASTENAAQRVEAARELVKNSAALYYRDLSNQIKSTQVIDFTDLQPPNIESILRYLRIPLSIDDGNFVKIIDKSAEILVRDDGVEVAIHRFCGLPVPLPKIILDTIDKLNAPTQKAIVKRLLKLSSTPLSKAHFIRILMHLGNSNPAYYRLGRLVGKVLLAPESRQYVEVFINLLNWFNAELSNWSAFSEAPPSQKLSCVWIHTHQIYTALVSANTPAQWIADQFNVNTMRRLSLDFFDQGGSYWQDIIHPHRVKPSTFLLLSFSYALQDVAEEIWDQTLADLVVQLAVTTSEGNALPPIELLSDTMLATNSIGSFLGTDLGIALSPMIGDVNANHFSHFEMHNIVTKAVYDLEVSPLDKGAWLHVALISNDLPIYSDLFKRFRKIIKSISFVELLKEDVDLFSIAIRCSLQQAVHILNNEEKTQLSNQLTESIRLASQLSKNGKLEIEKGVFISSLLDLCFLLANSEDNFEAKLINLAGRWKEVATYHQEAKELIKPVLRYFCENIPLPYSRPLWTLLLELRAG